MSPLMLPQPPKSPCSKSENDGDPPQPPHVIQIPHAALSSSLAPHMRHETGSETNIASVANELAHLAGLKLVSSQLNQAAAREPENSSSTYSQHQQEQQQQLHQNVAPMHSWQGDNLGGTSQHYQVPESPIFTLMGSESSPESYPTSYHQRSPVSWMPSQSLSPTSSYSMNGGEGGRLQQSRVEPTDATNHNGQMLNEKKMQQTVPADDQNSVIPLDLNSAIPMDQNVIAMFGWQEHGQEESQKKSQSDQIPQSPDLSHVGPEPRFYAQSYPQQATESSGSWMPRQHAEHSSSNSMHSSGDGGLPLLYSISNAGTDQYGRTKIVIQFPRPPIGQYQSIIMNHDSIALSCWQDCSPEVHELNGQELLGPVPSLVGPWMPDQHGEHSSSSSMPGSGDGGLQPPCEISSAGTAQHIVAKLSIPAAAEPPSIPVLAIPNVVSQCPLDPSTFTSKPWTLEEVKEIEAHVRTASSCPFGPHLSLQDLVVTGLEGHERSTPLLMACLHGDVEAVKRIVDGWGVNLRTANFHPLLGTLLVEVTPLLLAASRGHSNVVHFLLENGATVSSRPNVEKTKHLGLMPFHGFRIRLEKGIDLKARDNFGFSIILYAAKGRDMWPMPNFPVFDLLLERDDVARTDKIDALELAGAVIFGNENYHHQFPLALHYWSRALALCAEGRPLYKTPIKSKNNQLSEWSTKEDLLQIEQDPTQREIQSLLVRLRIFSSLSWKAVHVEYLPYFMKYLKKEVDENHTLSQKLDFSSVTIEKFVRFYPFESELRSEAIKIIDYIARTVIKLPKDDPFFNSPALNTFVELVMMTDLYVTEGKKGAVVDDSSYFDSICSMFAILSRRPEIVTKDMKRSLKQMVRRDCRHPIGFNVLHRACFLEPDDETVPTVRLLLKLKADPNVVDFEGFTPLHYLAEERDKVEIRGATARLLLEAGAHLDIVNCERKTPTDIWMDESKRAGLNVWDDLPDWLKENCKSLKCLSARVIRDHQVPYHGTKLPTVLIPFVDIH